MADSETAKQAGTILAQIGGVGLVSGAVAKLLDHILGLRKNKAEARARENEGDATVQDAETRREEMFTARMTGIFAADAERMKQMSEALEIQSRQISEQSRQISEQSRQIVDQSAKLDSLQGTVERLVSHISKLEGIIAAKGDQPPPRPYASMMFNGA
jgi:uncharacterized coiled-coil protein SlyX